MQRPETRGKVWTRVLSIILRSTYAIGVLVFVAFFTDNFSTFQRIVVLLVALIVYAAVESVYKVVRADRRRLCDF